MSESRGAPPASGRVTVDPAAEAAPEPANAARELAAAKRRLAEVEATYRSIFENAVEGFFQTTPDGRYLTANPALARIYGYPSVEAMTSAITDIAQQLYVEPARRAEFVVRMHRDDEVSGFESQIRRQDGAVIWILENARAVRGAGGTLLYYEGNVQDVTERKRAEEALQRSEAELRQRRDHLEDRVRLRTAELTQLNDRLHREVGERIAVEEALRSSQRLLLASEEHFRALIEHGSDMVTILDADRVIRYAGGPFAPVLGYPATALVGTDPLASVHRGDRAKLESLWQDGLQRPGLGVPMQFRARHADGSWRIMETVGTNLLDNPAVRGVVFNTRDVTEREQAKAALYLRDHAISSTSEGITISDPQLPDHPLIYVNRGFEQVTGYSSADTVGRNCRFLQGPESDPRAVAAIREALAAQRPCTVEILNYRKDGRAFWNLLSITPVWNSAGNVTNFIGVQFDITSRKEVERLKNELVATVSHELRTPLASLRGFTELMLNRDFPPERQREFLTIIQQESLRLSTLINDFLDVQRMESGRQTYDFGRVDLAPVLREAAQLYGGGSGSHAIRLETDDGLPAVWADADRVRQVLGNLVSNAIKFSPDGGEVRITARRHADEVMVAVADAGIGIAPEAVGQLFTKFYRVDNAATRRIRGTGLGLSLVKQIVEAHHGRVSVESTPGRGSTFSFTVPIATAHAPSRAADANA